MARYILTLALLWPGFSPAQQSKPEIPSITNLKELAAPLKLSKFKGVSFKRKLKIAILDNGFNGYEKQIGVSLPRETFYERYSSDERRKGTNDGNNYGTSYHGTLMAQTLAGIIRESGVYEDYELYLFLTYGYTKFANAIEEVAAGKFDLVLYSQVWEYGGNGDGKGFINELVKKALASGVVWVNAAGNFGRSMKVNKVDGKLEGQDEYVVFSGKNSKGVQINCAPLKGSKTCPLRLTLAWNDFKDDANTGTDKDLDLYLEKAGGDREAAGVKIQTTERQNSDRYTLFPRELIEKDIPAGSFTARVQVMSKNFSPSQDWLRITASGSGIKMKNPSAGETILPPADLPGVIVIGASDDNESGESKKLDKPDVKLKSSVRLSDGTNPRSSSLAAAVAAGALAVHLGTMEEKTSDTVADLLLALQGKVKRESKKKEDQTAKSQIIDESDEKPAKKVEPIKKERPVLKTAPRRGPTVSAQKKSEPQASGKARSARSSADSCLPRTQIAGASGEVRRLLSERGTVAVIYRGRPAILVSYNFPYRMRVPIRSGQRIFAGPSRVALSDPGSNQIPGPDYYEVISTRWGHRACN